MKIKFVSSWTAIVGVICAVALHASGQTGPIYKQFGAKVIDVSNPSALESQRGKVAWVQNGIVGLNAEKATGAVAVGSGYVETDWVYDRLIAVTNFPDISTASVGKEIYIKAIKIGLFDGYQNQPIDLYDCGSVYRPPPLTPEQIKAAQAAAQLRAARDHQRYLIGQTNAVRFLLSEATNGDASAQCSLGEHYLAGLGCETNRDLAIQWLQKAADGGSMEASNKLSQLKSP
jgi:TPR repeat protein